MCVGDKYILTPWASSEDKRDDLQMNVNLTFIRYYQSIEQFGFMVLQLLETTMHSKRTTIRLIYPLQRGALIQGF